MKLQDTALFCQRGGRTVSELQANWRSLQGNCRRNARILDEYKDVEQEQETFVLRLFYCRGAQIAFKYGGASADAAAGKDGELEAHG